MRGYIESDAVALARFARDNGFEMRFIEYMPIGADKWEREKVFSAHELLELLESEFGSIIPAPDYDPRARRWIFSTPTAAAGLASLPRYRAHSAEAATAFG